MRRARSLPEGLFPPELVDLALFLREMPANQRADAIERGQEWADEAAFRCDTDDYSNAASQWRWVAYTLEALAAFDGVQA